MKKTKLGLKDLLGRVTTRTNLDGYVVLLSGNGPFPMALEVGRARYSPRVIAGWGWLSEASVLRTKTAAKAALEVYEARKGSTTKDRIQVVPVREFARLVPDADGNGRLRWRADPKANSFSAIKTTKRMVENAEKLRDQSRKLLLRAAALERGARAIKGAIKRSE